MSSKGVIHYGEGIQPKCRPRVPFPYFAWATWDKVGVSCILCLAWIERNS